MAASSTPWFVLEYSSVVGRARSETTVVNARRVLLHQFGPYNILCPGRSQSEQRVQQVSISLRLVVSVDCT